jgi:hypothetical protein
VRDLEAIANPSASIIRAGRENANGRERYIAAATRQTLFQ